MRQYLAPQIESNRSVLEVFTLGNFLIKRGNDVISDQTKRSQKIWDLFRYLLTHRGRRIDPQTILESLWPEEDYSDAKRSVRVLIHRLRKVLDGHESMSEKDEYIVFAHGGYGWNTKSQSWLDVEEFERLFNSARDIASTDPPSAIELYNMALSLYKGEYLPEAGMTEWVIPARKYYQGLYTDTVLGLTGLLRNADLHSEIIRVCEKAFLIEPSEEEIHTRYLEALLEEGVVSQALAHYNHVTSWLYREFGTGPSTALQNVYRLIRARTWGVDLDLSYIQEGLREPETHECEGAYFCEPDVFRVLYNLERRRLERTGSPVSLILLTLIQVEGNNLPSYSAGRKAMRQLREVLVTCLRKGDVFCQRNDVQYIVMLPGSLPECAERVARRIDAVFKTLCPDRMALKTRVQSLSATPTKRHADRMI